MPLGDIPDGERSTILVKIVPDTFGKDAAVKVDITLILDEPETGMRQVDVLRSEASFSKDATLAQRSVNQSVMVYANVLNAMEKAEEAIQGLDTERFREARAPVT